MATHIDITGQKFGRWTAVAFVPVPRGRSKWECVCSCGSKGLVPLCDLRSGKSKSCGCYAALRSAECNTTHGEGSTNKARRVREHGIWLSMLDRCRNPKTKRWHRYGGRGIRVCDRWLDYSNFLADMGRCPEQDSSIERINNDGDYEPGNCIWAPARVQNRNTCRNKHVVIGGEKLTITDACLKFGVNKQRVWDRVRRGGLSHADAFFHVANRSPAELERLSSATTETT